MKNLKKVLALVLVFASLLGLATMASATTSDDYSDAESITHVEAVDVMSTIGVFDGISGAFSGSSILTREQAAKIITYMILGKDDADSLVASVAPYTDVARDRWSAGSIAYCKNAGILAGVGNGRFEPNGKLTGVAFAKMCLVALGYDPDVEKLTGSDWAVNTSKLAIASAGITANLSQVSLADEMSREDACQMAFNTLKADLVDYADRGMSVSVNNGSGNDIVISSNPSKAKPVDKTTARVDELSAIKNIKKAEEDGEVDYLQFGERYFPKLKVELLADSFNRPANVWTYKAEEIGTYRRDDWLVQSWTAKVTKGEMYNAVGSSVVKKLENNTALLNVYANGCDVEVNGNATVKNWFDKNSTAAAGNEQKDIKHINSETGNGVLTQLYMDNDGKVWISMINTYLVKANADYNSTKESVSIEAIDFDAASDQYKKDKDGNPTPDETGYKPVSTGFLPNEISNDDFDVTGVKEGDYLLVTVSGIDANFTKCTLEEVTYATVQKGTVTEYTEKSNVVMGGTKYSYNKILRDSQTGTDFAINSEATLVLDTYGYIMHVDDSVDSSKYVYIAKFAYGDGLNTNAIADAYFTDGTNEHITVSKVDDVSTASLIVKDNPSDTDCKPANWYTYTGTTGGKYTLKSVTTATSKVGNSTSTNKELIKNGTVKFMSNTSSANIKGDNKTIFVIKTADGVSAYTGVSNVPTVKFKNDSDSQTVYYVETTDHYAKYVFVDASSKARFEVDEGTSAADYMFILKNNKKTTYVDGYEYQTCTVVIDGKIEERQVNANEVTIKDGCYYYSVKEDSHGRIKSAKEVGKDGDDKRRFVVTLEEVGSTPTYYAAGPAKQNNGYVTSNDTTKISRSGSTLSIPALNNAYRASGDTANKGDLITTEKSSLNVVISGSKEAETLRKDKGADYEVYLNASISQLYGLIGDKKLLGRIYLVTTTDNGGVVDSLWVYVDGVL